MLIKLTYQRCYYNNNDQLFAKTKFLFVYIIISLFILVRARKNDLDLSSEPMQNKRGKKVKA